MLGASVGLAMGYTASVVYCDSTQPSSLFGYKSKTAENGASDKPGEPALKPVDEGIDRESLPIISLEEVGELLSQKKPCSYVR